MSQTPHQKLGQKMCKSPKNSTSNYQIKPEKIDYENLSTNCTVVGSNNLNLVKKPQIVTNMSPAYSNPSPGYPPSPYSSPASLKSPSPNLKPPTPQPSFPVMQIINSHSLLARPIQTGQSQNIIKLKPHLNILPKPSASPQPSPKPSVSPQIVIPNQQAATIMPTAQPVLLNQMPLLTTPGVQFILRPQTKMPAQMSAAAPQGLILQPSGQPLLQIPRSQPMVRVLTNGVQLAPSTTTTAYVTTQMTPAPPTNLVVNNAHQQQHTSPQNQVKKKPKNKVKKKLDLANLMKLSGIGDEDDIQFESDASQSESEPNSVPNTPNIVQQQEKKLGNIQLSAMAQPTINTATPVVQVLNQNFQSGMISNSSNQAQAGIPFNPFIAPNFTINNGLMVQRSGGFKLTMGEDGRLVLQHDPTLNQDLQSQLILQSIFGLNGGLVLQPSMDQQTVQQTVQTIQQQSVQTIQQQTVQSQTIQTVQQQTMQPQHTLQPQIQQQTVQQTIQHQTVQSQPLMQQPMQIVQPQQTVHSLHSLQSQIQGQLQSLLQHQQNQAVQTHQIPPPPSPTFHHQQQNQPVLKVQPFQKAQPPVQTVHPQPIVQQPPQPQENHQTNQPTSYVVNLTPDQLEQLKRNGQLTVNGQTIFMQRPSSNNNKTQQPPQDECKKLSPKIKPVKKVPQHHKIQKSSFDEPVKEKEKSSLITALQSPPKHVSPPQKQAIVQPSIKEKATPKPVASPPKAADSNGTNQDVEKLLGQLLEESGNINIITSATAPNVTNKNQRIHTIQLTPQKQEHLKNIQMQIQTLSASLTPGNSEIQAALKMLFAEQQKILATGKLLPPDKVYYHNNHLTIINPSSLNLGGGQQQAGKGEGAGPQQQGAGTRGEAAPVNQVVAPHPVSRIPPADHSVQQNTTSQMAVGPRLAVPQVQQQHVKPSPPPPPPPPLAQQQAHSVAKKAHLIEAQLNLDQSGAVKPDIHTPFRDKKDACIRLIRYHCLDQPVLSQKDLQKADEIFELTAEHFIAKYAKMVDKYKYLLMKESMRPVQTSELMMLDRMYLTEERQSLMRLRQEAEEAAQQAEPPPPPSPPRPEDYDEWACIQRELGCLPPPDEAPPPRPHAPPNAHAHPPKRTASSDSRLETLKRFRVDKHKGAHSVSNNSSALSVSSGINTHLHPNSCQGDEAEVENNSIDEQVQSAIDSILNLQQNTALDLDSILS